jgi:hypothetical protein
MVFLSFLLIAPVMGASSHKRETLSLEQEISAEANIHSSLIRRENRDMRRHGRIEMKVGSDVEFEDIQAAVTPLSQLAAQLPTVTPAAANITNKLFNASLNASIAAAVANSITANTSINDALAKAIAAADAALNNSLANNRAAAAAAVNSTRATTTNPPINTSVVDDLAKAIAVAEAALSKSLANNQAAAAANITRAPNTSAAAVAGSTSVTPSTSAARFNVTTAVPSSIASTVMASSTTSTVNATQAWLAWQAAQAARARPPAPSREELELQAATEAAKKAVKDVSTARALASKTIRQAKDTVAGVINATLQMQATIDTKDLRAIAAAAETVRTAAAATKTYWSMAYNDSLDFRRKEKAASKADYLKRKLADFVAKVKAEEAAKAAAAAAAGGSRAKRPLADQRTNVKIQAKMQARKLQATTPEPTEEPVFEHIEPETPTEAPVSSDQPTGTLPAGNFTTNATIIAASSATAASAATKATAPSSAASPANTRTAPTVTERGLKAEGAQDVPAPQDAISEDEDSPLSVAVISCLTIMVSLMMSAGIYWVCCHGFEDEYDVKDLKDLQFYPTGTAAEPLKEKVVEASAGSSEVKRSSIPAPVAPAATPTPVTASEAAPATAPDVEPSPVTASGSTDDDEKKAEASEY